MRPNSATAPPHSARMATQSSIEPSWFPQVPLILYSSGLAEWLLATTVAMVVSFCTKPATRQPKAASTASSSPAASGGASAMARASARCAP